MIEQLNSSGYQKLSAEMASERLQSLLRIGQTLTAKVLEVTPQPARPAPAPARSQPSNPSATAAREGSGAQSGSGETRAPTPSGTAQTGSGARSASPATAQTAASTTTSTSITGSVTTGNAQSGRPASPVNVTPASTNPGTGTAGESQAQSTKAGATVSSPPLPSANAAAATAFRTRLNIAGRILEIVTPRALTPGSEVQITREGSNQISLSVAPRSGQSPSRTAGNPAAGTQPPASPAAQTGATTEQLVRPGERALARVIRVAPEPIPARQPANSNAAAVQTTATAAAKSTAAYSAAAATAARGGPAAAPGVSASSADASAPRSPAASGYRITLELQGRQVEVNAPAKLPVGTEVRIRQDAAGRVTVEVPAAKTQAVENALRQHLPIQQPPAQLLNLLADPQNAVQLGKAQPILQSLIQILLGRSVTSPQNTNAEGVRQQLQNSGTLLENRLARGDTAALGQDHKALLLKLEQRLATADPKSLPQPLGQRITQMTQQAISRVLFNQVSSLAPQTQEAGSDQPRQLVMDIPVLWQGRNENVQLRINGDERGSDSEAEDYQRRWQVQLRFDMEGVPPMGADLLLEGDSVSVLWFGDQQIRRLIEPQLQQLQGALEDIGLEVTTLAVREQTPPQNGISPPRQRLIDTRS